MSELISYCCIVTSIYENNFFSSRLHEILGELVSFLKNPAKPQRPEKRKMKKNVLN